MELWDAYNRQEEKAGVTLVRGNEIPDGLYHLVCDIVVRHTDGDYLLLKRDFGKESFPGFEEIGAGGSALKGETPVQGARRELLEESGIQTGEWKKLYHCISDNTRSIYYGYLCVTDHPKDSIVLQEGETIHYRWINREELISFFDSAECMPPQKDKLKKYIDSIR